MKSLRLAIAISIAVILPGAIALAQHAGHATDTKSAALISGLGATSHVVSTKIEEAQKFFDQGLALIYGFNHESASKSFRRAMELDPNLAMAYWGFAYAVGPNYNEPTVDTERMKAAYEAMKKAQQLSAGASQRERDYISAMARRFSLDANPDVKRLGRDYMEAMREVYQRYPDDLDAATLYADSLMNLNPWQLWTKDGKAGPDTDEIVAVLESVLARDPNHLGANHLYIHAVEASASPQRALPSAKRLETLAPSAGHLVHMPGHIYLRTGDFDASAKTNEVAAEADRQYLQRTSSADSMYAGMYYSHNLHFLVESYGRMGLFADASRAASQLEANVKPHVQNMPMLEGFVNSVMFVRLRFARWDDVLRVPEPDQQLKLPHSIWQFSRAVALAATGKVADAEKAKALFLTESKALPGETPFGLNSAQSVLAVAHNELDARIAWAKGNKAQSIDFWQKAVMAQEALNYDEPPDWYHPVRESLGAALLQNGNAALAEEIFRADLKENPRNGRSLFGLKESLKAQGKTDSAMMVEREFKEAWKRADTTLKISDL